MIPRSILTDILTARPAFRTFKDYTLTLQLFGAALSGNDNTYAQLSPEQQSLLAANGYILKKSGDFFEIRWKEGQ